MQEESKNEILGAINDFATDMQGQISDIKKNMATKDDIKNMATKDDIDKLDNKIDNNKDEIITKIDYFVVISQRFDVELKALKANYDRKYEKLELQMQKVLEHLQIEI